ncbi:MAG: amino acid ABC transporter substrate-binding protein [Rhodospirillaceae bacterium]|nr:amino acid ABC transporter substrate-binding protein [Rhodospirillaceae bacterium]MCY4237676.1 amino acid ABC transporter substrate-binding protein [Rhodospirillaceae bacterium]
MMKSLMILAAAALAVAWASPSGAADVKIGYSIAKTGLFAPAAPSQINAYNLWAEQVNARGGLNIGGKEKRKIKLVQYDDQSSPGNAVRIYEKLITQDKVDLLLSPWGTPHHFAIASVVERHKFPMIGSTASSVQLRSMKPGNIWFTTAAIPDKLAAAMVGLLKNAGVKTVAILTNQLPFGQENKKFLMPALKAADIKVVVDSDYPPNIKDMTAILAKVKAARPDAILALAYPGDSILYMNKARELGLKAKFQYVMVGPAIGFWRGMFKNAASGIVTLGHWSPHGENARAQAFYAAYLEKFKEEPDYLDSVEAWVSTEILEQAVAKAGLDKDKLRKVISTSNFDTIIGRVQFDGVQNAVTPTGFLQIQDGNIHIVWPKSRATAKWQAKPGWK